MNLDNFHIKELTNKNLTCYELDKIVNGIRAATTDQYIKNIPYEAWKNDIMNSLEQNIYKITLFYIDDEIAGLLFFAVGDKNNPNRYEFIQYIYITPEFRKLGVPLLKRFIDYAKSKSDILRTKINASNKKLKIALKYAGFIETGNKNIKDGNEYIEYKWVKK